MGNRTPNAGRPLFRAGIQVMVRPYVGCEIPAVGPGYHIAASPAESIPLATWLNVEAAIVAHNAVAVAVLLNGSAALTWWARAAPVLAAAWPQASSAAQTLWSAPGAPGPTQWSPLGFVATF